MYESVAFLVGQHMAVAAVSGEAPPPMPERGRAWSIYDLFETADGEQVFVGVTSERHWARMCETFGFEDWAGDAALSSNQLRIDAREWFLPELKQRFKALQKSDLMRLAESAGIPFAPVNKPQDLFEDVHLNQSGGLTKTKTPNGEDAKLPKIPLRLDNTPFDLRNQPPKIGEGSREAYLSAGFSNDEITEMLEEGVIEINEEERPSVYINENAA